MSPRLDEVLERICLVKYRILSGLPRGGLQTRRQQTARTFPLFLQLTAPDLGGWRAGFSHALEFRTLGSWLTV